MTQRKLMDPMYVYADPKRRTTEAPVLVAIGGAAAATFGPALFGGAFATIGSLGVFTSFLVRAALGVALYALTPKNKPTSSSSGGYRVTASGSALDHQIIYGTTRCAGVRVYDASSGPSNSTLHRVLAFAGHEIDQFVSIYVNDEVVTLDSSGNVVSPSRYNGRLRIYQALGSDDQEALPRMLSNAPSWTAAHRLRGIAYLYVEMDYSQDAYPNGVPEITALIRGKKVYDPRTGVTEWSDNAALCLMDYFRSDFGLGVSNSKIDDVLFQSAANVCDENVVDNGIVRKRYTCNGSFTTGSQPIDIIQSLITALAGIVWYAQGKWRAKAAKWTSPVLSIVQDDFRSGIQVSTRNSRRDNFNVVKGTYKGEQTNYQITDYPNVREEVFLEEDGGFEVETDFDLPYTDDPLDCQRIARIFLRRNREQLAFTTTLGLKAFQLQVGDNVTITNPRYGWANKTFEVGSWSFTIIDELDIVFPISLREVSPEIFDNSPGEVIVGNNTTLPSPFDSYPVGLSISQILKQVNETVLPTVLVNVTSDSPFINEVEVEYKLSSSEDWIKVGKSVLGSFEIVGTEDGFYDFRARAISVLGVRSQEWTTILNRYVSPFAEPPSDVLNFYANVVNGEVHLTWNPVPDLDLSHYRIKFSSVTVGATWSDSIEVVERVARPANSIVVPARNGTYLIKAVDKLGNESLGFAASVVNTNIENIQNLNVVETLTQEPSFSGTKVGVAVGDFGGQPVLTLEDPSVFDDFAGDFDSAPGLFDFAGGEYLSYGEYYFDQIVDLGQTYTSRISSSIVATRFVVGGSLFDSELGNFDSKLGLFDGLEDTSEISSMRLEFSATNDDPSGSPSWSAWQRFFVSDVTARAIRFRLVIESLDASVSPAILNLSVTIDMPDRVESQEDITVTGSASFTFPQPFVQTPAIGVSIANLTSGQRYGILSKSRTGFVLEIRNSDNSLATNPVLVDYVAKGYGRGI